MSINNLRVGFENALTKDYPEWKSNMLSTKVESMYHFYCCGYVAANSNINNYVEAKSVTTKNNLVYQD